MRDRRGVTTGDVLIGLAIASLVGAIVYPTIRGSLFRSLVDDAVADVETLRRASLGVHERTGTWPTAGDPGEIPVEVSGAYQDRASLAQGDYALQWGLVDVVEQVPAPRPADPLPAQGDAPPPDSVGTVLVSVVRTHGRIDLHSTNSSLLAELLVRYGADASFVRDTTWTLVVTRPSGG